MKQAGFLRQSHSGVFHLLPLGLRVQEKIESVIDNEMHSIGASKLALSSISSEALWEKSGRLAKNPELLRLNDRKDSKFILSPTHEEEITTVVSGIVKSYKDLPVRLYQMSRKYRDELRPRQGLLRAKEFLMKDLYTFDLIEADAMRTYEAVKAAYTRIFDKLGLQYLIAEAASGNMGGNLSHEYQLLSPIGEDTVFSCTQCGHAANEEVLDSAIEMQECSECGHCNLEKHRAIEVGHTFHLGTRYSDPLQATVADRNDKQMPLQMGCHGIGISRIIAAAAALRSVGSGLRWPLTIAPFKIAIVCRPDTYDDAIKVYDCMMQHLNANGRNDKSFVQRENPGYVITGNDLIVDDRDKSIGWKLKDADLIGYPVSLVLGSQYETNGTIDVVRRDDQTLSTPNARKEYDFITRSLQSLLEAHRSTSAIP